MNKVFLSILLAGVTLAQAQTSVDDSVSISAQYKDAVFYKLSDGTQTKVSNTNWHLAFSVQKVQFPSNTLPSVTIRYNGGNNVMLSQKAFNDTAFYTADTIGFSTFNVLYDSDSNIDTGSFNNGLDISHFDYGWGVYNMSTKNIPGRNVFYIKYSGGLKKFRVVELTYDTIWQVQYANIDNSDMQTVSIPKAPYFGKQFVYLNLETNDVLDREPMADAWDLLFHKYAALNVPGIEMYPSSGVWINKNASIAKLQEVDVNSNDFSTANFTNNMREIGYDWKEYVAPSYVVEDSLVFFVKTLDTEIYKLIFTGFSGSATGTFYFTKTGPLSPLGINEIVDFKLMCYPNPATSSLTVVADNITGSADFSLIDLSGRKILNQVLNTEGFNAFQLDLSNVPNGFYIASITQNGASVQQRIVINR